MQEYKTFFKMIAMRFIRGFVAGSFGSLVILVKASSVPEMDLLTNYKLYILSFIGGGIVGGCLAVDKWVRATEEPPKQQPV